jgi:uncharacterized protein (DUF2267 family)
MQILHAMNQQATLWIKDMMLALRTTDADQAMHAMRAGLQALRDRLSVDEAAQLSAQLPLIVRGMFFEGWEPSGKPLRIRHREEFLALVRQKYAPRQDRAADEIIAALFRVMRRHVSEGEITDVMLTLPTALVDVVAPRLERA